MDFDMHMRHFANRLRFKELYLVDVGTDTLRINRDRHTETEPAAATTAEVVTVGRRPTFKQRLKRYLADWDTRGVDSLTFFTVYDLDSIVSDRVVRNDYAYLKSVAGGAKQSDKVFFVGQPLVDQRYLSWEAFRFCIGRVREFFIGQSIVYVAHPRESEAQLSVVREIGLEIKRFALPFEYAVMLNGERPGCIASFFSSVVDNCASIFGATFVIKAFRLPDALILKDHAVIRQIYAKYAKNKQASIEVLDFFSPGDKQ